MSPPPLDSLVDAEHLLHRIKHIVQKDGHKTRSQVSVVGENVVATRDLAAHLATQSEQTNIALAKMGNGIEKMGNGVEKVGAEMGQHSQCLAVQTQVLGALLERTQVPTLQPSVSLQSPLAQPPFDDAAASPSPTAAAHVSAAAKVLSVSQWLPPHPTRTPFTPSPLPHQISPTPLTPGIVNEASVKHFLGKELETSPEATSDDEIIDPQSKMHRRVSFAPGPSPLRQPLRPVTDNTMWTPAVVRKRSVPPMTGGWPSEPLAGLPLGAGGTAITPQLHAPPLAGPLPPSPLPSSPPRLGCVTYEP